MVKVSSRAVLVLGAGKSGIAVAKLLKKNKAKVFLSNSAALSQDFEKILKEEKISYESQHKVCFEKKFDFVVASPGIRGDSELLLFFRKKNIPIVSEIEVGFWFLPQKTKVIGITGTNGKSTVTAYLDHYYKSQGFKSAACGNFGLPLAEICLSSKPYDVLCLELSSYQLESTASKRLDASIFLNLQEDHLLRYGAMREYLKAKTRIFSLVVNGGVQICDFDVFAKIIKEGFHLEKQNVFLFGQNVPDVSSQTMFKTNTLPISIYGKMQDLSLTEIFQSWGDLGVACVEDKNQNSLHVKIWDPKTSKTVEWQLSQTCLSGLHNHLNLTAASLCLYGLKQRTQKILKAWETGQKSFKGLVHRLENVTDENDVTQWNGKTKRIRWINDSKATNTAGVEVALKSQSKKVRILLGGHSKGEDFSVLIPLLKDKAEDVYLFGSAAEEIRKFLESKIKIRPLSQNLESAMALAFSDSADGDTILLSPGCASFDEFNNFEERGEKFKSIVLTRKQ